MFVAPFAENFAVQWASVFEADHFQELEYKVKKAVTRFLVEFEKSAPPSLKKRLDEQKKLCLEEVETCLQGSIHELTVMMSNEQKIISRRLTPEVQKRLTNVYDECLNKTGKGSYGLQKVSNIRSIGKRLIALQQEYFRDYLEEHGDEIFSSSVERVMGSLDDLADTVEDGLRLALNGLAKTVKFSRLTFHYQCLWPSKIRAHLRILWDSVPEENKEDVKTRSKIRAQVSSVRRLLEEGQAAVQKRNEEALCGVTLA